MANVVTVRVIEVKETENVKLVKTRMVIGWSSEHFQRMTR